MFNLPLISAMKSSPWMNIVKLDIKAVSGIWTVNSASLSESNVFSIKLPMSIAAYRLSIRPSTFKLLQEYKMKRCIGHKWTRSQMADGILKFMIGHIGLGSSVQLGPVDFKVF